MARTGRRTPPVSRICRKRSGVKKRVDLPQTPLDALIDDIRACRLCRDEPNGAPLPHEPRPVLQASAKARLAIFGQAPGLRVHESGKPFTDPSGDRLRDWLGVGPDIFYDPLKVAIIPMGFCFPGYDKKGSDLPPRKECAAQWREALMAASPQFETMVLVGGYAQSWHLKKRAQKSVTATVERWRDFAPLYFPTPHPSWRNNGWIKARPWFEAELVPALRAAVKKALRLP